MLLKNPFLLGVGTKIEIDLPGRAADVAEVRIGHLAGPVDDAAHDGDGDARQVAWERRPLG